MTSGRILHIAVDAAERAPGVLAVITHVNTPPLAHAPATGRMGDPIGPQPLPPFQSDVVLHYGQHVAMVVAETREEANAAAALVEVTYERHAPVLSFDDPRWGLPCMDARLHAGGCPERAGGSRREGQGGLYNHRQHQ